MRMRIAISRLLAVGYLALVAAALAGCGSGGSETTAPSARAEPSSGGYIDWPQFGRVPARTHYLPEDKRALDPPLKEA
jgi:hypothetical protein